MVQYLINGNSSGIWTGALFYGDIQEGSNNKNQRSFWLFILPVIRTCRKLFVVFL